LPIDPIPIHVAAWFSSFKLRFSRGTRQKSFQLSGSRAPFATRADDRSDKVKFESVGALELPASKRPVIPTILFAHIACLLELCLSALLETNHTGCDSLLARRLFLLLRQLLSRTLQSQQLGYFS
jgi:hypothetical protein